MHKLCFGAEVPFVILQIPSLNLTPPRPPGRWPFSDSQPNLAECYKTAALSNSGLKTQNEHEIIELKSRPTTDSAQVRCGSNSEILAGSRCFPLYPWKRTSGMRGGMSTAPGWQEKSSRRRLGRCSHVSGLLMRFT